MIAIETTLKPEPPPRSFRLDIDETELLVIRLALNRLRADDTGTASTINQERASTMYGRLDILFKRGPK